MYAAQTNNPDNSSTAIKLKKLVPTYVALTLKKRWALQDIPYM